MNNCFKQVIYLTTLISFPLVSFTTTIFSSPAAALEFDNCAQDLLSSGIAGEAAAIACADALEPEDLSDCVAEISQGTSVEAEDALQACYRVRRPEDLSDCVVNISSSTEGTETAALALSNCRLSLLPDRYSECVVELSGNIPELGTTEAMETCISAESFPQNLFPEANTR